MGNSPQGRKELDTTKWLTYIYIHTHTDIDDTELYM